MQRHAVGFMDRLGEIFKGRTVEQGDGVGYRDASASKKIYLLRVSSAADVCQWFVGDQQSCKLLASSPVTKIIIIIFFTIIIIIITIIINIILLILSSLSLRSVTSLLACLSVGRSFGLSVGLS